MVEETGEGVDTVKVGDRVVTSLLRTCGRCTYFTTGSPNLCMHVYPLDTETRIHNGKGDPIAHGARVAAFAEYAIVDQTQVVPVDSSISMECASLLACGVITGLGAVVNTARVEPGSSVVVIGVGGVGLNSIQGASLTGANPIIALDLLDEKLDAAKSFGATHALNITHLDNPENRVQELTEGLGAEYVFVTVGSAKAVELGHRLLRPRGTEVLVGILDDTAAMTIPLRPFPRSECRIVGSFMGSTHLSIDIPRLVAL